MLALDDLFAVYPSAKFLWTHRDPADVLGSVCSLIAYTRSWVSDRDDAEELGREQLAVWSEAINRALEFRRRIGEECFADIDFASLQSDPVGAVCGAYEQLGIASGDARPHLQRWADDHPPGAFGSHEFALGDFGLDRSTVRESFAAYLERFGSAD
jgi:hypothetical protein